MSRAIVLMTVIKQDNEVNDRPHVRIDIGDGSPHISDGIPQNAMSAEIPHKIASNWLDVRSESFT